MHSLRKLEGGKRASSQTLEHFSIIKRSYMLFLLPVHGTPDSGSRPVPLK